jgi:hypothetical protein
VDSVHTWQEEERPEVQGSEEHGRQVAENDDRAPSVPTQQQQQLLQQLLQEEQQQQVQEWEEDGVREVEGQRQQEEEEQAGQPLADPFSPQPSVGSAPSFRWSSPPPAPPPPAAAGGQATVVRYEEEEEPATPTLADFGIDSDFAKRYGIANETIAVAAEKMSPMEKVLARVSAGPRPNPMEHTTTADSRLLMS